LCLKTSISSSACTLSPNFEIFAMLPLMRWERGEFESMRPRASLPSLLAWLRVLGVDGWGAKEGGGVGRVIFRDGSPRTFLEFKGDIPQASNARRIEFTL
jgi:hypothetical protein